MRFVILVLVALVSVSCGPVGSTRQTDNSSLKDTSAGGVRVLFHPTDPSLKVIASELLKAKSNIDIAMYSMDVTSESPVIQALASADMQRRLLDGSLRARVVFEGYGSDEDNTARSKALEDLNLDVRWFSSGRKVHHKFAAIDAGTPEATVISGSANWSLGSMKNYDEAIMVFNHSPAVASVFQKEFNLLWELSDEFGATRFAEPLEVSRLAPEDGIGIHFNTANFKVSGHRLVTIEPRAWVLTRAIVGAIDQAKSSLKIASTRIVLRPVYNALRRAAARGVKVEILVNQDQYEPPSMRAHDVLAECDDEYRADCSRDIDFPWFLDSLDYPGRENVTVRVKFFSLNTRVTLARQMHSKYVVVDDSLVSSGSFNWSESAEYNHIENVATIDGHAANGRFAPAVSAFVANHGSVFNQGRGQYDAYIARIETAIKTGVKTDCSFAPMALTFQEIDYLLDSGQRAGHKPFKAACE